MQASSHGEERTLKEIAGDVKIPLMVENLGTL